MVHLVYWIKSGSKNYIGYTSDMSRRLLEHNGMRGTKYTTGFSWRVHRIVGGFTSKSDALKYEFMIKRKMRKHKWRDAQFTDTMSINELSEYEPDSYPKTT
jgi:predicted GIY-YIG superfamily endonuclease